MARGLLDTSVMVATETGRKIRSALLPDEGVISVVTVGELRAGVLSANDEFTRAARLATLEKTLQIEILPIDDSAAAVWATIRVHLAESERRFDVNDLWIAATAIANRLPVYTQDDDFSQLDGVAGLKAIKV